MKLKLPAPPIPDALKPRPPQPGEELVTWVIGVVLIILTLVMAVSYTHLTLPTNSRV